MLREGIGDRDLLVVRREARWARHHCANNRYVYQAGHGCTIREPVNRRVRRLWPFPANASGSLPESRHSLGDM